MVTSHREGGRAMQGSASLTFTGPIRTHSLECLDSECDTSRYQQYLAEYENCRQVMGSCRLQTNGCQLRC